MGIDPSSVEMQQAIDWLNAGWEVYLIEDKPYPAPHQVVLILDSERQVISYNTFAILLSSGLLQQKGSSFIDGKPAEVYTRAR